MKKNGLTILYAEDEEIVRESFTEIFSKYFKKVITAENGTDALKLYQENLSDIDIAILDIAMPGIDGLSLASKIREQNQTVEIIMLTGHADKEKLLKAINLQLFSYLLKPIKKAQLNETLTRVIEKSSQNNTIKLAKHYKFDTKSQILFYKLEPVRLSKNEKNLVSFMSKNINTFYSACEISEALFEHTDKEDTTCNNVIQLISRFKKKMLNLYKAESFFIDNIYAMGYKIQK